MLKDKSKKPSSKTQSTKVEKLPTLTIAELEAITGAGPETSPVKVVLGYFDENDGVSR